MDGKRISCRAIIIEENKLVSMYREKQDRVYYTFPGGGKEENETELECVVRECLEEFGINVLPIKKVYVYEDENTIQNFYLCKWVDGELGSGEGEEFQADRNRGIYIPTMLSMEDLADKPLMPPHVAKQLISDYKINGKEINNKVVNIQL